MVRFFGVLGLAVLLAGPVAAQGLWSSIKEGAQEAGQAIGRGAQAVGDGAQKVGQAVSDEVNSTTALFDDSTPPDQMRGQLDTMAEAAFDQLRLQHPDAARLIDEAAGYAVFDLRKVTGIGFTAGAGRGVTEDAATATRRYMKMATAGLGLGVGIGGFESRMVILFDTEQAYRNFTLNGLDAGGQAGARMGQDGEDQVVRFRDGRAVFLLTKNGWRITATLAGTRYWPDKRLNGE